MICASVYLLVFIRNLLVHLAEKILLMQPLTFGGDYPLAGHKSIATTQRYIDLNENVLRAAVEMI